MRVGGLDVALLEFVVGLWFFFARDGKRDLSFALEMVGDIYMMKS